MTHAAADIWHIGPLDTSGWVERDMATPHLGWAQAALESIGDGCSLARLAGLSGDAFRFDMRKRPEIDAITVGAAGSLYTGLEALGYSPSIFCGDQVAEAVDLIWGELDAGRPVLARGVRGAHWGMVVGLADSGESMGVRSEGIDWMPSSKLLGATGFEIVAIGDRVSEPHYPEASAAAIGRALKLLSAGKAAKEGPLSCYVQGYDAWGALLAWFETSSHSDIAATAPFALKEVAVCVARRRTGAAAFLARAKDDWLAAEGYLDSAGRSFREVASAMRELSKLPPFPMDPNGLIDAGTRASVRRYLSAGRTRDHEALEALRAAAQVIRRL
jgi:hypothetical protein